jgi:hypothetical protein
MAKAPDCQFCGAFAFGEHNGGYHTSCGTYHIVLQGKALRSPDCKLNQLRQQVREAVVRLGNAITNSEVNLVIEDLRKAVGDE